MKRSWYAGWFVAAGLLPHVACGQFLYQENFDVNHTSSWLVNSNGLGTNAADFFFNYSSVGIPPAPRSAGGSTRGLKLQSNLNAATAPSGVDQRPAISVSPVGRTFAGNYEVHFDWWSNYIGPLGSGTDGSTMLSTFGIMTSGNVANSPGTADGVFFAATGDGQSASDYRAYSPERLAGYDVFPGSSNPVDQHATFEAGSRNSTASYYQSIFPPGATAPSAQSVYGTQTGSTSGGAAGFRWHDVLIRKSGNLITWSVNGELLISVDSTSFSNGLGGANILFGHSDTNNTTNLSLGLMEDLQFTLIDNVTVIGDRLGDFNDDGLVDSADYVLGRKRPSLYNLATWRVNYGRNYNAGSGQAVPEPSLGVQSLTALLLAASLRKIYVTREGRR